MNTVIGNSLGVTFSSSSSSSGTSGPTNVVITPISGGNRITFTTVSGAQTEIWYSIDGGSYTLLGRYANSVTSVNHTGLYANIVDYKLRGVIDDITYDTDAISLFDRMGATTFGEYPDDTRKGIINTLFVTGKTKAFWNKLDAMWLMAAHGAKSATLNALSTSFTLTQFGVPCTFTIDRGFTTDGNKFPVTNYNPSVNATHYSLNSASMGVYSRTNVTGTGLVIGAGTSATNTYIQWITGTAYSTMNSAAYTTTTLANMQKLLVARRTAAGTSALFYDKTKDEESKASSAVPNEVINIGVNSFNQFSFAFVGGGLDDTDISDLYDVVVTGYLNSIGAKI